MSRKRIVLASASPRRSELLETAGIIFSIVPADIPEEPLPGESPTAHVLRLAEEKALVVAGSAEGDLFIGADTVVVCGSSRASQWTRNSDSAGLWRTRAAISAGRLRGSASMARTPRYYAPRRGAPCAGACK